MSLKVLLSILLGTLFGMLCSNMAGKRGKNTFLWFQMGFFFGLFGLVFFLLVLLKEKVYPKKQIIKQEASLALKNTQVVENQVLNQKETRTKLEDREWFYLDPNHSLSSALSFNDLKTLIQSKVINETTLIWSEGMDKWKELKDLAYLKLVLNLESCNK